jgi:hypothetical protein
MLALAISCHCGAVKQTVRLRAQLSNASRKIDLCHCASCRHNSGLLCVSYTAIEPPGSVEGLEEYDSPIGGTVRLFCRTCGCHVFQRLRRTANNDNIIEFANDAALPVESYMWRVATGVITGFDGETPGPQGSSEEDAKTPSCYLRHVHTASTKDGGLSLFIRGLGSSQEGGVLDSSESLAENTPGLGCDSGLESSPLKKEGTGGDVLDAHCHCGTVRFHITRPDEASKFPRSNFPDLMIPYHTGNPEIQNPKDDKWWLRPVLNIRTGRPGPASLEKDRPRRYLAGTCACRSCRLTSGFEIQTWAFVPRANIFFHINRAESPTPPSHSPSQPVGDDDKATTNVIPLDFSTLPPNIIASYESTAGVRRDFCSRCGATVFWRDKWRPELLDVSVGLLDAEEGARAETWLDWWTTRVSFAEDAERGRSGEAATLAACLINGLQEGLRKRGEDGKDHPVPTSHS